MRSLTPQLSLASGEPHHQRDKPSLRLQMSAEGCSHVRVNFLGHRRCTNCHSEKVKCTRERAYAHCHHPGLRGGAIEWYNVILEVRVALSGTPSP